ncbi:hypothetical protein LINPERHAP1_LOCUS1448 [Linum perenne]
MPLAVPPTLFGPLGIPISTHFTAKSAASRWNGKTKQIELGSVGRILCFQPIVAKNEHGLEISS